MLLFLFRFMFILVIIGTAFLCGINNVYVPFMISPNLGRYFPANIVQTLRKCYFYFKNVQLKCFRKKRTFHELCIKHFENIVKYQITE